MKAAIILLSIMAFSTLSQAQHWAYDASAPYIQQQLSEEDPTEGKIPLGHDEIPVEVMDAFRQSPFQHMTIIQAFRLQDQALDRVAMGDESRQPLFLYELRLVYEGKQTCLYFTPDGQLYENAQSV